MNKYKEALKKLEGMVLTSPFKDDAGDGVVDMNDLYKGGTQLQNEYLNNLDVFKELVERATPKKLVSTRHTRRCPSCNRQMSDINNAHPNMKFCPNCGQALDWEIRR